MALLIKIRDFLSDVLFPSFCVVCNKYLPERPEKNFSLCSGCLDEIEINNGGFCSECNKRIPLSDFFSKPNKKMSAKACRGGIVIMAPCSYSEATVREIIYSLKYKRARKSLKTIDFLIKKYAGKTSLKSFFKEASNDWIIVPIPLHPSRKRERGFNQSEEIAEIVGKALGITVEKRILARIKNTKPQVQMENQEDRKNNVAECFFIVEPNKISGKKIILVDDIFTTGATIKEAIRALKKIGAKRITGFVVAKT